MSIEFVLTGFYNSFFPKVLSITAHQTEKKTTVEINRYYNGLTAVTILLVPFCIFVMPLALDLLVRIFNKPDYLEVINWIPYIAITYLLRSIRFYVAMPYGVTKYSKPLPLFYIVILAVKICGMILLVPGYGIHGVIMSTWISYGVEVLILYFGIKNRFIMRFNTFKLLVAPIALAVVIGIAEPILGKTFPFLLHLGYVSVAGFLLLWAYRNEVKVFNWNFFSKLK
jgi:O-antigen/teichoic acid export membrane protein